MFRVLVKRLSLSLADTTEHTPEVSRFSLVTLTQGSTIAEKVKADHSTSYS